MYERYYGFRELPFELTSNPRYLFFTAQHRECLCHLEYGLSAAKPVTVLIGEAGTGKSTLLRAALDSDMCRHVRCVFIDNPTLTRTEFFETLATKFELGASAEKSKASLLGGLESIIRGRQSRREITALIVDEYATLRTKLLALPSKAKQHHPELTLAQLATIDAIVREALEALAADASDDE
jgi:general secretion pathway protein A